MHSIVLLHQGCPEIIGHIHNGCNKQEITLDKEYLLIFHNFSLSKKIKKITLLENNSYIFLL